MRKIMIKTLSNYDTDNENDGNKETFNCSEQHYINHKLVSDATFK